MGYLLDELGLHATRLLGSLIGQLQLSVALVQFVVGLAALPDIEMEEGHNDNHDDDHCDGAYL